MYDNIQSYSTDCLITTYTKGGKNTYNCKVDYNSKEDTYTVTSDDMKFFLTNDKCIISKGANTIESPSVKEDMYIFINTFFKSYYECEDTALEVGTKTPSDTIMLECSIINPTKYASSMSLSLHKDSALPVKMSVMDSDGAVNTEVQFTKFVFLN